MRCLKNGVGADFGQSHVYPGDIYMCPKCRASFLFCNASSIHDKDYTSQELYVEVDEEEQKKHDIPEPSKEVSVLKQSWEAKRDAS